LRLGKSMRHDTPLRKQERDERLRLSLLSLEGVGGSSSTFASISRVPRFSCQRIRLRSLKVELPASLSRNYDVIDLRDFVALAVVKEKLLSFRMPDAPCPRTSPGPLSITCGCPIVVESSGTGVIIRLNSSFPACHPHTPHPMKSIGLF